MRAIDGEGWAVNSVLNFLGSPNPQTCKEIEGAIHQMSDSSICEALSQDATSRYVSLPVAALQIIARTAPRPGRNRSPSGHVGADAVVNAAHGRGDRPYHVSDWHGQRRQVRAGRGLAAALRLEDQRRRRMASSASRPTTKTGRVLGMSGSAPRTKGLSTFWLR